MSRPTTTTDITAEPVEFATVDLGKIATDPALLKGYTAFLEAATKAGAVAKEDYRRVTLTRVPNSAELAEQLTSAQRTWDERQRYYEQMRDVGECEYAYQRNEAQKWAEAEGLPFPPEHEPISAFDAVINGIDEAVAS